ncbi:unnamed protein product [Dibothriocephalus latus]|uniref:Uncharacterized protein n=1 Tax=Dibothriocephalus latus TaxID=60516 RepID=A0A3P7LXA8_DIBLA|nr:unnamed protein product [Dibothriocephalus latus]
MQHCVSEAKVSFLRRLCHHIVQVSCLVNNPDELLTDIPPDELLDFDLETVFNLANVSLKSKKFSRQLGRAISMKTPRRIAAAWSGSGHPGGRSNALSVDRIAASKGANTMTAVQHYSPLPETEIGPHRETSNAPSTPLLSAKPNIDPESMVSSETDAIDHLTIRPSSSSPSSTPLEKQPTSSTFLQPIAPPLPLSQSATKQIRGSEKLWLEHEVPEFASDAEDDTVNGGDADEYDLVSIDSSSNMGPWPAFLPRPLSRRPTRLGTVDTPSTSSLRSTYSLDPHAVSGKQEHQSTSATLTKFNRSSAGGGLGGDSATRKSICRSMLDGLRTLRRSLADPKFTAAETGLARGRKSVSGYDLACRPRVPIAETEVPNGPLPLIRQSTAAPGNCLPPKTHHRAELLGSNGHHEGSPNDSASSHSIGSWNSLITLDEEVEEDEDCASARRRRCGHLSKTPVETCSLILPSSSSDHKKRSFGSRTRSSKSTKKRGVFLLGSAIFHKPVGAEGYQSDLASRRDSFFKRGFLRK